MTKLVANQFTIAFEMTETISLMGLCDTCGYSLPTKATPWAEKTLADGSRIQFHRDLEQKTVYAIWYGNVEDWGAMRFAVDNIYLDLAAIGYVPQPQIIQH
jgi:hypothetical protein